MFSHLSIPLCLSSSRVGSPGGSITLASLMERLSVDSRFFSPHRAYIINLEHITALNADSVLLSNGQRVPVSRANLPALKRAYLDYLF